MQNPFQNLNLWPSNRPPAWEVPVVPPDADPIDLDLSITPEAVSSLVGSVGARRPETGAKLFGPVGGFGVDVAEFDEHGSAQAGGAIYSPDTTWGSERLEHWISQEGDEQRIWTGDAHSHPGGFGRPSRRSGPGLGDLGYVEAVFEQNEVQFEFCIPILTGTGPGASLVQIHPWVVLRSEPLRPRWARFRVCPTSAFPTRRFNPAFEAAHSPASGPPGFDLDRLDAVLRRRFGTHVFIAGPDGDGAIEVVAGDVIVRLDLDGGGLPVTATVLGGAAPGSMTGTSPDRATDPLVTASDLVTIAVEADEARRRPAVARSRDDLGASGFAPDAGVVDVPDELAPAVETSGSPGAPPFAPAEYYARVERLISPAFHDRSILVVGASGGSYLIEKLARLGPRRMVIVDHDVVEVPNLVRTAFRIGHLGMSKPSALAALIAEVNPFVAVEPMAVDVTTLGADEVRRLLDDVDLIVAGTDSFEAQAELNRWSQVHDIPAVFIGVHERAAGGVVRWSIPGTTACYRCMASARYDAAEAGEPVDLPGEPGLLTDVQSIDMVAASVIIGLLERGQPTPKGELIEHLADRTEIVVTNAPAYRWGRDLYASLVADLPAPASRAEDLGTYLGALPIVTLPTAPVPGCPDCRSDRRATSATVAGDAVIEPDVDPAPDAGPDAPADPGPAPTA